MVEWFSGSRAWTVEAEDDGIPEAAKRKKKAKGMPDLLVDVPDRVRHLLVDCLAYNTNDRPTAQQMRQHLTSLAGIAMTIINNN